MWDPLAQMLPFGSMWCWGSYTSSEGDKGASAAISGFTFCWSSFPLLPFSSLGNSHILSPLLLVLLPPPYLNALKKFPVLWNLLSIFLFHYVSLPLEYKLLEGRALCFVHGWILKSSAGHRAGAWCLSTEGMMMFWLWDGVWVSLSPLMNSSFMLFHYIDF